jgi:hypothetical protein
MLVPMHLGVLVVDVDERRCEREKVVLGRGLWRDRERYLML